MSKHHHYHHPSAGGFHHPAAKGSGASFELSDVRVQPSPSNGLARVNGQTNGAASDVDSNDTNNNNNYNKHHHNHHNHHHHHHHNHHHGHHKRSASSSGGGGGGGGGSGESSSSKRTKLSGSGGGSNSQSVPNFHHTKYGNSNFGGGGGSSLDHTTATPPSASIASSSNSNGNHSSVNSSSNFGAGLQHGGHYNIMEKLKELYRELKADKSLKDPHLSASSFLLDKLVTRERLNTLIINLYPGNKGYTLAYRSPSTTASSTTATAKTAAQSPGSASSGGATTAAAAAQADRETLHETPSWLYDNAYLLDALDAEELPPLLIDFCNEHCPHLFYNGAVIAQIRDYRQSYPVVDICDIHYVLLRPTAAALWDEVNGACDSSWTTKDRVVLESQLVLATAPPICLDPSPAIGIAAINATTERSPIASADGVLKMAKKFLQVTKNRNNKLEKKTHYPQLSLANFVAVERRQRRDAGGVRHVAAPKRTAPPVAEATHEVLHKTLPAVPPSQRYDWQARNTERLTFETDRDNCQYRVRVELFERPTTCEMSGQLTLERQKSGGGGAVNGRMCPFKLASPLAARRYVKEFMGIFTEEGRKFVKITHERETRGGREILEMQTGEKLPHQKVATPVLIAAAAAQPSPQTQLQSLQQLISSPSASSITSPPPVTPPTPQPPAPPALVAATPTAALKLTATPQRIIAARQPGQQVVVLAQVKQESAGNQAIKNLLNQPRAPMTQSMVNGLNLQTAQEVQTVYVQVDNNSLIHMGGAVPANLQFQQVIVPTQPAAQTGPQTYTMNVQTVTPQQVTVVKRHRDM